MSRPVVTIAIPYHNPGADFSVCLKSVFCQTFKDWELILIDDGSSDGSTELAASLDDPRVRAFSDGKCLRLNARLNQSARLARGEFLFRMDSDDVMQPRRVEEQLNILSESSPNTVLGSAAFSIDVNSQVVGWRPVRQKQVGGFAARHSFIHPTVAARTEWFLNNPYSESFIYHRSQDAELWSRTTATSSFRWISTPLLFYREQGAFKIDNYLATQTGILHLLNSAAAERGILKTSSLILRETGKLAVTSILASAGRQDLIIRKRYKDLPENLRSEAQSSLGSILLMELPSVLAMARGNHLSA